LEGPTAAHPFWETEVVLGGGHSSIDSQIARRRRARCIAPRAAGLVDPDFEIYAARHYPAYWLKSILRVDCAGQTLYSMASEVRSLATEVATDAFRGVTELTIVAPDHPACCRLSPASARARRQYRRRADFHHDRRPRVDTIFLSRAFVATRMSCAGPDRIAAGIEKTLRGEIRLGEMVAAKRGADARAKAFALARRHHHNNLSNRSTVIEVSGLDRPGLLYDRRLSFRG